VLNIIHNIVMY